MEWNDAKWELAAGVRFAFRRGDQSAPSRVLKSSINHISKAMQLF